MKSKKYLIAAIIVLVLALAGSIPLLTIGGMEFSWWVTFRYASRYPASALYYIKQTAELMISFGVIIFVIGATVSAILYRKHVKQQ